MCCRAGARKVGWQQEHALIRRPPAAATLRLLVMATAGLGGCAGNPMVRWEEPPPPTRATPRVLDEGRDFSALARRKYQEKMDAEVTGATQLSTGLIGLGAVVAALAAGHAHRDAILGTALLGATAYSIGSWTHDKRRLLVYNGAISAINCADRAVTPLDATEQDLAHVEALVASLSGQIAQTQAAVDQAQFELDRWVSETPAAAPYTAPFARAIAAAQQAITAAGTAQASGEDYVSQSRLASRHLVDAVRRIDQEANAALMETVGDLSKVPSIIAGLAGVAGSIAPGSNVESALSDALRNAVVLAAPAGGGENKALAAPSTPPAALVAASNRMAGEVRKLHAAASLVLGRVRPLATAVNSNALADCGIGPINFALSTDPAKISAVAGVTASYPVTVRGGKAPFAVNVYGAQVPGIERKGPDRMSPQFTIDVKDTVPAGRIASYRIEDSSDPPRSLMFSVETIGPAPAPPPPAPSPPAAPPNVSAGPSGTQAQALLAEVRKIRTLTVNEVLVDQASPPRAAASGLVVTVSCKVPATLPAGTCLTRAALQEGFRKSLPAAVSNSAGQLSFTELALGKCLCK
jgi:hypothetical protein